MLSMSSSKMTQDLRTPKSQSPRRKESEGRSAAGCRWWILQVPRVERNVHKGELLQSIATPACSTVIFILVITLFVHHTNRASDTRLYLNLPPRPQMINNLVSARDLTAGKTLASTQQPVRDGKDEKRHEARKGQENNDRQTGVELVAPLHRLLKVAKMKQEDLTDADPSQGAPPPPSNESSESQLYLSDVPSPGPYSVEQPAPLSNDPRNLPQQISLDTLNSSSISPGPSASDIDPLGQVPGLKDARLRRAPTDRAAWVEFPYAAVNETEHIMLQIRQNGTLPCHNVSTQTAHVLGPGFPQPGHHGKGPSQIIRLVAGPLHDITIVSIGEDGRPRCAGGDFYETDLSGPRWKSRPPVLDHNDGTYSVRLQVDQRFALDQVYNFTVTLLFTNFNSLRRRPRAWARLKEVATYQIEFVEFPPSTNPGSEAEGLLSPATTQGTNPDSAFSKTGLFPLPLPICRLEDFNRKYWSGRWTREHATQDCDYDKHGRWKCVDTNLECQKPWCEGKVGKLESNGWVYSAHCAFKLFEMNEAWKCLDGKWLFFWGDSNHIDTIRNLLNFVLGFEHRFRFLDRRMDKTYASPLDGGARVRITSMFNGHSNVTKNYEGLHSLRDREFAAQLRSFFTGDTAPDVMIMNSGLHDGVYWRDIEGFVRDGVDFAADFWADVWSKMRARRPDLLYRTTVSTGGRARKESFNPHKMEVFNHLMLDRLVRMELERFHIIDGFDYTFPWHYDHKTNDGVHYGRPPMLSKWAGGNIGHRYFVDLMLVHMLLNAICPGGSP